MNAIDAAVEALTYARHALANYKAANKRPAFATEQEKEMWSMKHQSTEGAKGQVEGLRKAKNYAAIVWDMDQVIAYGKAAAKIGAGNCMEFAAVACVKLNKLRGVPPFYAVELEPPADHVFVAIGQDPDGTGEFPMDFADWHSNSAICDPWANIACQSPNYPTEWHDKMDKWNLARKELPKPKLGVHFGGMSEWVSPRDPFWFDGIVISRKLRKAGPGTGKDEGGCGCCFITTAVCQSLGLPEDCPELTILRRFRDEILLDTAEGRREVMEYYALAPAIVAAIARRSDAAIVYAGLHADYIRPSVEAISLKRYDEARALFRQLVRATQRDFLLHSDSREVATSGRTA